MESKSPLFVSVESPYRAATPRDQERNIAYAILATKQETKKYGNAVYASHLLLTQTVVDGKPVYISDDVPDPEGISREEALLNTNLARSKCDAIVFYTDLGWSGGMLFAKEFAIKLGITVIERTLDGFSDFNRIYSGST